MEYFGVDIGYGYTKAAGAAGETAFPSVVGRAENIRYQNDLAPGQRTEGRLTIGVNGVDYFVGDLALQQSRIQLTLLDRSRTNTDQLRVLFLATLAQLIPPAPRSERVEDVVVVTGLPVEYYDDRDLLAQQLVGAHGFCAGGYGYNLTVHDLQVVPQPFGSIFDRILDGDGWIVNDELARARIGVIDIGTYTTDYVLVNELMYIERGSGSLNVALSTACDLLVREVAGRFGLELDLHQADQCLRRRTAKVFGEVQDIGFLVDSVLEGVAEELINKARTLWGEGRDLDAVLITGGGGQLLGHYFQVFPHARVVSEPAMANVRGFLKYARRGLRGKRAERATEKVMPA